jgi:TolB-like protein/ankyrin repeat protein/class 3 adenylate cyclase
MVKDRLPDKLAVILHADVAGSTQLVQQDEHLAHERIQDSFRRFGDIIEKYRGRILELRGDALLAEFERASDAVTATLAFQSDQTYYLSRLKDELKPGIRVGIAMGEVVMGDGTVTGAGVVLAQRVEQLADPGSVCITAALHEALPNRMPFDLENIGEQTLKGFDDPVRVYRVELHPGASIPPPQQDQQSISSQKTWQMRTAIVVGVVVIIIGITYALKPTTPIEEPASIERMAMPLPDKPSIAILPFTNMSGDPEQEYFTDGMTEDLITDISKVPDLFVIARNSVFTYKGKSVKVRQVAEELGVRYVLEGSVRRVADQVRINAQLIDATTGGHLWADRYDGSMADVFALQDSVVEQIVKSLAVNLKAGTSTPKTVNTQAYDDFLKGWAHYQRHTEHDFIKAIPLFESAIKLDANYAQAHAALAAVYWETWENQWAEALDIPLAEAMENAKSNLQEAMKEPSALAHWVASNILIAEGKYETAASEAQQIIALDSNNPGGYATLADALALSGNLDESKKLYARAQRLDPFSSPLHAATLRGEADTVKKLIAEGIHVDSKNYQGRTALHLAALKDHGVIAMLLIEAGANTEIRSSLSSYQLRDWGSTPLMLAARTGNTEVVEVLIEAGADVDARDIFARESWAVLHHVVESGHLDVAILLVANGADIDVKTSLRQETPLFFAAREGFSGIVELLIDHGADINAVDSNTSTLLHKAMQSRDLKVVQLLLGKGAMVNAKTTAGAYPGETPLHVAALVGYLKGAELLLLNGAEIDAVDRYGHTPLRRSVDKHNPDMTKLLINKGADVTTRDVNGISLLHVVAQTDDVTLAAMLIKAGADVNGKDKNLGFTPLDYAQDGEPKMIVLLEQNGAICTSC